jgi:hypothetical protein
MVTLAKCMNPECENADLVRTITIGKLTIADQKVSDGARCKSCGCLMRITMSDSWGNRTYKPVNERGL